MGPLCERVQRPPLLAVRPANDVALMLILAVAVIWAVMGVYDPETYGWRFLRRVAIVRQRFAEAAAG